MTNTCDNPPPAREIPIADIHKTFDNHISTLDPQRAQSITDLASVRSAKATTLAQQQSLLTRKLGAHDPRVTALVQQQARNATLQTAISAEGVRAQTTAPVASAEGYVFHGYVFNAQRQPLAQLSVALYDNQGEWFSRLGYGCTDKNGYFLMRYDRAVQPKPAPSPYPSPQPAPAPSPAPQPAPQPAPNPVTGKLFGESEANVVTPIDVVVKKPIEETLSFNILVFDQQQKLLYRDPNPLHPQLGHVDYRIIIIGDHACTCATPPETTSPVAPNRNPVIITHGSDIASLRKKSSSSQVPVSSKTPVPVKIAAFAPAKKRSASSAAKRSIKKTPSKKSTASKSKPPSRKKKKSR